MASYSWPLQKNSIGLQEKLALTKFLWTSDRFTNGPEVKKFEEAWSKWQGKKYSLYVSNGSCANFLLLDAVKELYFPNRRSLKIFAPAINWSTNLATFIQQKHDIYLYDIDRKTYSPTWDSVSQLSKVQPDIVYLTHVLGISNDMEKVKEMWPNAMILEDCCESHGAKDFKTGKKVGTTGEGATFSFYFGHHMTTIEGGMICTDNENLYNLLKAKRSHGLSREMLPIPKQKVELQNLNIDPSFLFPTAGYNFRNIEFGAVLGQVQLKKLDHWNEIRNKNYQEFYSCIKEIPEYFYRPATPEGNSAMVLPFHCKDEVLALDLKRFLNQIGVETRPFLVGNVTNQPFMKRENWVASTLPNASQMDSCSFYIGNNQFVNPAKIQELIWQILCEF
ncbi:MAG: putative lipopolysaccharide biosynthesis protein [Prokaryotic dsDNA virus sp.]|nr:MAG: putative lipopolysaccharide biosynthesis protein [Prokaryotic dsDNA virus sp.]|tara:strand:- start:24522 stop:25694 length:1173 start_codon:yes stop_codon:yes gene_type:complete